MITLQRKEGSDLGEGGGREANHSLGEGCEQGVGGLAQVW